MKQLDKLTNEALAQSVNDPSLFDNFSMGFKKTLIKLGTVAVFGVLTLGVTGMAMEAHAMDGQAFGVATGVSGLVGMASNGSVPNNLPPECANVQGKNGWTLAGGGTAGALLGSNIGKGSGSKWATVVGTLVGTGIANGVEDSRIQRECQVIVSRNLQQQQQLQQQYNTPRYNQNNNTPTSDILYQAQAPNGQNIFVTVENSPGLLSLTGNRQGVIDPHSTPVIYNGVKQSLDNLGNAYVVLDNASKRYLRLINGSEEEVFNPNPDSNNNYRNNTQVSQASAEYDRAYNSYAGKRGIAAHILDEASARNYNLNEFSGSTPLFQVPQSAKVTYSTVYHKSFENRYANDIKVSNGVR